LRDLQAERDQVRLVERSASWWRGAFLPELWGHLIDCQPPPTPRSNGEKWEARECLGVRGCWEIPSRFKRQASRSADCVAQSVEKGSGPVRRIWPVCRASGRRGAAWALELNWTTYLN
jgi:hypothetical protein